MEKSDINSFSDMMSPHDAEKYRAFFVKDAPNMVFDGTKELDGIHSKTLFE